MPLRRRMQKLMVMPVLDLKLTQKTMPLHRSKVTTKHLPRMNWCQLLLRNSLPVS
jgi:hypothetical protein